MHFLERPRGEREEVSADGLGFGKNCATVSHLFAGFVLVFVAGHFGSVGYDGPILRSEHFQLELRLQVRLVKTRKRHVSVHRNKQRVDVFAAIVLVFKARDRLASWSDRRREIDLHHVFAQLEQFRGKFNVTILNVLSSKLSIHCELLDRSFTKIQPLRQNAVGSFSILHKPQLLMPADRIRFGSDRDN